jgi:hypothetical protein
MLSWEEYRRLYGEKPVEKPVEKPAEKSDS